MLSIEKNDNAQKNPSIKSIPLFNFNNFSNGQSGVIVKVQTKTDNLNSARCGFGGEGIAICNEGKVTIER